MVHLLLLHNPIASTCGICKQQQNVILAVYLNIFLSVGVIVIISLLVFHHLPLPYLIDDMVISMD